MAVPPLVSVTVCAGLVVLTVREPKPSDPLDRTTVGAGAATINVAMLVLALLPAPAVNCPALTLTAYEPGVALWVPITMVQLPMAGMLPMPKLYVCELKLPNVPQVLVIGAVPTKLGGNVMLPPEMNADAGSGLPKVTVKLLLTPVATLVGAKATAMVGALPAISAAVAADALVPLAVAKAPAARVIV